MEGDPFKLWGERQELTIACDVLRGVWDDLWSGFTHDGSFIAPEPAEPADIETLFGRGDLAREQSPIENAGSAVIRADNARAVGRAMEAVLAQPFTCRDGAGGGHAA